MIAIRIHGRGGQGAKTAAELVAEAALTEGKYVQAFPEYGPERSGAPVRAYVRISDKKIKTYAPIVTPDVVLVIDPTLVGLDIVKGLKDKLIVNTNKGKQFISQITRFKGDIYVVDATKIAIQEIGKNVPNTAMIGALIKVTNVIKLGSFIKVMREHFIKKIGKEKVEANIRAIKLAYAEVR